MATLESGILKPRQDLYVFILYNWIRFLFLPSIDEAVRERLLIFGVGRIFSAYSNIGVQYCTDADLNFVLDDSVPAAAEKRLIRAVAELKQTIWDLFTIIVEVNSSFTVLRIRDIRARLAHRNRKTKLGASLFYKGNSGSLFIIHNNSDIHTAILDEVSPCPIISSLKISSEVTRQSPDISGSRMTRFRFPSFQMRLWKASRPDPLSAPGRFCRLAASLRAFTPISSPSSGSFP